MILLAIFAFLVIFSALILVHEWGHFQAARSCGVKVEEFGLGLPPLAKKLWKDKKGTTYTLNWLPLGGFVRMKGEDSFDKKMLKAKDSFAAQPVWQRIMIVCAGVFMNFVTGFVLLAVVAMTGSSTLVGQANLDTFLAQNEAEILENKTAGVLISGFSEDSLLPELGIKKYDFIRTLDGIEFEDFESFQSYLTQNAGTKVGLGISRRDFEFEKTVTVSQDGKLGFATSGIFYQIQTRYTPGKAVIHAGNEVIRMTSLIFSSLGDLGRSLAGGKVPEDIGGPVAIAKETFYRASNLSALVSFAAMLSVTLAVFNILPIPALDGGRLIFLVFEGITRRRVSQTWEMRIHGLGYIFLLGLIALITFKDIFLG